MKRNLLSMLQKSKYGNFAGICFHDGGDDDDTETPSDEEGCPDLPDYADDES